VNNKVAVVKSFVLFLLKGFVHPVNKKLRFKWANETKLVFFVGNAFMNLKFVGLQRVFLFSGI